MNSSTGINNSSNHNQRQKVNQNIQVYVRVRPLNARERGIRSTEVIDVISPKEILTRHSADSKLTKKFTFDRTFGPDSKQADVYNVVVAPLIEEVLSGYNCTVFAYGQTGTGKTHTMVGTECAELKSSWEDDSTIGIIPRALSHLFDELRLMGVEFSMRISYLELYNEELCDLLSSDDSTKIRIFDDSTKKGSVIIQGLEEIPVHSKDDVYKLLEKGKERRKTATTLMNAQSSRSHTVFSILVHIRENGIDGEEMLKIGKLNLVDLAGSENVTKAGNERGIRVRETVNINQSLLTLGRVITALVERTPHIPYRESKLTRLLQESLGGRTKTSIIATISPGHKDIEETLSTLEYAHRAKNIQNKPEVNQKLTKKTVLKEYTEEIDKLKRDLIAARDKNGIYLAEETYNELTLKMDSQNRELNEKMLLLKALKDELLNKEKIFNEVSLHLVEKTEKLKRTENNLNQAKGRLLHTKKVLTTTKRRYKEKKILLQSHVKTEVALTDQATKLLEVADKATNDTHQLHNTIERRKNVDISIQSACEKFTSQMQVNFEYLDENLDDLQQHHKSHAQLIMDEITNSTKVQNKIVSDAKNKIENVYKIFDSACKSTNELTEKYTKELEHLNEEHKIKIQNLFQDLKNNETKLVSEIQANILALQSCNEEQNSSIDTMQEMIKNMLKQSTDDLTHYSLEVQKKLKALEMITKANFEEFVKLQNDIDSDSKLNTEELQLIDEFIDKIKKIQDKRQSFSAAMKTKVSVLQQNESSIISGLQSYSENSIMFNNNQAEGNANKLKEFCDLVTGSKSIITYSTAKNSSLSVQLNNLRDETNKKIDDISVIERNGITNSNTILSDYKSDMKRIRLDNKTKISNGCQDVQTILDEGGKSLKSHITQTLAFATSLENHVRDYSTVYKKQMSNCVNDLRNFKQRELKTYAATGTTPMKQDFVYPRILATTSPHDEIVKRFRTENDWSDLDTTATIDEEGSENDDYSTNDISDTETILNSTPIDDTSRSIDKSGNCNSKTSNTLKPPKQMRNSSLSRKLSPRLTSPRQNSPAILKDNNNKENGSKPY